MALQFWFWLIMFLMLVAWVSGFWWPYGHASSGALVWVLLAILGWQVFGAPVKG